MVKDSAGHGVNYVNVTIKELPDYSTVTDERGAYELKVPASQQLTLVLHSLNITQVSKTLILKPNQTYKLTQVVNVKENMLPETEVRAKHEIVEPATVEVKPQERLAAVNESLEANLQFQALGVRSNDELSSAYSVRGGNFDENLVYVNDFEVYRPYLIRSGQQEGLSFTNPDMAGNVEFSSGGFQAKYGDKMSSVMAVTYRIPDSLKGNAYGSLLGWGLHLEGSSHMWKKEPKHLFTWSVGARQRTSEYILKSLDTKGYYAPNFIDFQAYLTYQVSKTLRMELISTYALNKYTFIPTDRTTDFGLLTDVMQLTIYFNGQEVDRYQNLMNGLALIWDVRPDVKIKFLTSGYVDNEVQAYDILGAYYLSQIQSDLSQSNFGQVLYSLGTGDFQNWTRDDLNAYIYYAGVKGAWQKPKHTVLWGLDYKHEIIMDHIDEWNRLDSAGYSLPYVYNTTPVVAGGNAYNIEQSTGIGFNSIEKSTFNLQSNRITGYLQDTWHFGDGARFNFNYGARFEYWDVNKEFIVTPRTQLTYKPKGRSDIILTAATGLYFQPPFYREMRDDFDTGEVNTHLLSQKSFQVVLGLNYAFKAWNRRFNFTTEAYYKDLWDLVPYEYNDIQILYAGNNSGRGYATGVDMRLNGDLAAGAESWINMSVMTAQQKVNGAQYTVDSTTVKPDYFPLPTDQRVAFTIFFQDYLPKWPFIKVHIAVVFATGLPFGPPNEEFYEAVLRTPPYRRADIGFSGQLWNPKWAKKRNGFNQGLKGVWLSLEAFNIFDIDNTVSYLWIRDIYGNQYAVPNYLTGRRLNVKLQVSF